jgi:hypothetical protein
MPSPPAARPGAPPPPPRGQPAWKRRLERALAALGTASLYAGCPSSLPIDPPAGAGGDGQGGSLECADGEARCDERCVDTQRSSVDCGACGHDCLGGGCVEGRCQPIVLASGLRQPDGLALGPGHVYFTCYGDGTVQKVPRGGGTATALIGGEDQPHGIAVDATSVYWTASGKQGSLRKLALGGGVPLTLVGELQTPWELAVDSTDVYLTVSGAGAVMRVPLDGSMPTTLIAAQGQPQGIAIDADNVFFAARTSSSIKQLPIVGGNPLTLASNQQLPLEVAVDGSYVYWTTEIGVLGRLPIGGGGLLKTLLSGHEPLAGLALDADNLYYVVTGAKGRVMKMPKGGGAPVIMAEGQDQPTSVVVDEKSVYWTNRVEGGAVMKVAK